MIIHLIFWFHLRKLESLTRNEIQWTAIFIVLLFLFGQLAIYNK